MPHDKNGNLVSVGDSVIIRGTVTQLMTGVEYCNVTVELDEPMPPYTEKQTISALNTKQVEVEPSVKTNAFQGMKL